MRNAKQALLPPRIKMWERIVVVALIVLPAIAAAMLAGRLRSGLGWPGISSLSHQLRPHEMSAFLRAGSTATKPSTPRMMGEHYVAMPLRFEENRGQTSKGVQYLARAHGSTLLLTRTAAILVPSPHDRAEAKPNRDPRLPMKDVFAARASTRPALRMELANANPNGRSVCAEPLPGESNYFLGNHATNWITHVPNCAKVRYERVYPGIDLVYYGNHERLEYDYLVSAGADPGLVRLRLRGMRSLRLGTAGDLIMEVQGSEFCLRKPLAYQTGPGGRELVGAHYALLGSDLVGVEIGSYDHRRPLTIDPVLSYSTFLGGTGGDSGTAVAVDASGNMYLVGTTSSTNFPVTSGVVQSTLAGASNVFVTKLNSSGTPVFSTYLGGSGSDSGAGIALDASGNVYVTGTTTSTNFPTTGVGQTTLNGSSDAFVTKLNPTGTALIYSTYLGGSGEENGNAIAVDASGNAYVTGATTSIDFPTVSNSFQTAYGGGNADAFIAKLSPNASSLVYSSYLGGGAGESAASVAVDAAGEAFVVGTTSSTDFPTVTPLQATFGGGGADVFVSKFNAGGTALVFSTYLGGSGTDQGTSLALDASGNVYLTGSTASANFPTVGPVQGTLAGAANAFVSKLAASGSTLVYSTYLGGSGTDSGNGIAVDASGNAYVVGATSSTDFPSINPMEGFTSPDDAFVAEVAAGGAAFTFSSYLGGSGNDTASALAVDSTGNLYIIGTTGSIDFPVTVGSFQSAFGKVSNVFVSKVGTANQAGFTVLPTQLTFSAQGLGTTSKSLPFVVRNLGSGVLNTSSITTTGDFGETNNCGGVVSGAAACVVNVTFSPTSRGARTGTIVFADNAPGSPQTLNLNGTGVSPVINLSPNTLTFPSEPLNTTAPTQTVSMSNSGVDASTITSIAVSGDYTQTNTCGTSLAAGANCTITIAFTPTLNGTRNGTLSVVDNAAGNPHTVALTGTGVGPDASLSASALLFGSQPLGTTSGAQVETLTNDGAATMTLAGVQITGAFAQTNTCGASLAAGANCAISVTFSPTGVAGIDSGALTILDNAPGNPHTIVLSGQAVTGSSPVAYFSPASISFGLQPDGTTSAAQTLTLTNTGNAALQITSSMLAGSFTLGTNTCSSSLAAGASCAAQITFTPTSPGPAAGTFTVTDNAPGSPHVVNLSGGGTDFQMSASPGSATVSAGQTATYTLTVTPVYGFKQTLNLSCGTLPQATACAFNPATVTLDGTDPATVALTVSTTTRSSFSPGIKRPGGPPAFPSGRVMVGIFLLLGILTTLSAARSQRRAWFLVGIMGLSLLWAACSVSAPKITGTLAGTYGIAVTGSSTASGTLQHTLTVGLTVN